MKFALFSFFLLFTAQIHAQDNQAQTQLKVKQAVEKKAEYHRMTNGAQDGYRIKLYSGVDREGATIVREKFLEIFKDLDCVVHQDYKQPNFVIMVGDFKTKLEAFELLKKIQPEFPYAFIVKEKITLK